MNMIKVKTWNNVPHDYTGVAESDHGTICAFKNGLYHREDGPTYIENNGYKEWWLNGRRIHRSAWEINLTDQIILSKTQHPSYPTIQIWKILDKNRVYERIIIPGMEECIRE